jgi:hypothetical protein
MVRRKQFTSNPGPSRFLGTPSTVVRGRCQVQQIYTEASYHPQFLDLASSTPNNVLYINPTTVGQNSGWATVVVNCAIQQVGGGFRRFCFSKLWFEYEPTGVSTTDTSPFALCYTPDPCTTISGGTVAAISSVECSVFGPIWKPAVLNCTDFLDRSKWYMREVDNTGAPPTGSAVFESIQGTLHINYADTAASASKVYGMLSMGYEVHFLEQAPINFSTGPTSENPVLKMIAHFNDDPHPLKEDAKDTNSDGDRSAAAGPRTGSSTSCVNEGFISLSGPSSAFSAAVTRGNTAQPRK